MTRESIVSEVWSYANLLRDQGSACGDYIGQITHLLFLEISWECGASE
ncbi:restriction endonuclease subunit S [Nitrosomonas halophila]|nr:restriction endonuclease subunit S [Nitrosomonas halophila]